MPTISHNKLNIAFLILALAVGTFLPYFPHVPAGLAVSITGFLGAVNGILQKSQDPPPKKDGGGPPSGGTGTVGVVGLIFLALLFVACTKQQARSVVDAADVGCTVLRSLDPRVGDVCAYEDEIAPIVKHILAARRARPLGAAPGAKPPVVDACTVPLEVAP